MSMSRVFLFFATGLFLTGCASDPRLVLEENEEIIVRLNHAEQVSSAYAPDANTHPGIIVIRYTTEEQFKNVETRRNLNREEMQLIPRADGTFLLETRLISTTLYDENGDAGGSEGDLIWEPVEDAAQREQLLKIWTQIQKQKGQ